MRHLNWDDLRLFKSLIEAGTVRQAGEDLGISHSTVARRISHLEDVVGLPLVSRHRGEYVLTEAGRDMLNVARQINSSVTGLERRAVGQSQDLTGEIRLSMVDAMIHSPIMAALKVFCATYSCIHLELDLRNCVADLDRHEADLALRFTKEPDEHLIGRKLVQCGTAVYASKTYAMRFRDEGSEFTPQWIGFQPQNASKAWRERTPYPSAPIVGTIASLAGQMAACKAEMGMATLPCFMAEPDDQLERLSEVRHPPHYALWVLRHPDLRRNARVQVLVDFLSSHFKENARGYIGPSGQVQS
ncbi:hypothetical protein ACMU_10680 [Actibacterium mucosum KCTC 23349]|uniref:HTH lysR-type domain-containing protein n=2 Tax=Actibacterium TaxID=1433986 RepID=A0A037ZKP5_9RHOB|nr:hypothetical protein ACMU_10680 [Actibacterium mucosum KCTC 23349]